MGSKILEVNVDDYLYGGVYVLVTDLIRKLPSDMQADIAALEPFVDPKHIEQLKAYRCNVHYVGTDQNKIKKQIRIYKNVKALIEKEQYDVVHLHSDVAHKILISALAAKKCKVKKIIFHSHASNAEGSHRKLRGVFHKMCAAFLKRIPALRLATSEAAGRWMYPGCDDFIVLNNGVDYEKFFYQPEIRNKIRSSLQIDKNYVIGYVGRFVVAKNPFYLIDIMEELVKEIPEAVMLCVGEGMLKDDFQRSVKERNLSDHFLLPGLTDQVQEFYQAMDAVVLPSDFEGFGLVAIEAQVSGTPVAASEYVPEMTRISDLITYLPTGKENAAGWCEVLKGFRKIGKQDMRGSIDRIYDLQKMVDTLIDYYRIPE